MNWAFRRWVVALALGLGCHSWAAAQPNEELPARALHRFGTVHFRHGSRIQCLAYSPDGKFVAAGGGADPVRVWNLQTGKLALTVPEQWVASVAFSPFGSALITAGALKDVRQWDVQTGKEIDGARLTGHQTGIKTMSVASSGAVIASGGQDGVVMLWEVAFRKKFGELRSHTEEITSISFSPDGRMLATASTDRQVIVWNVKTRQPVHKMDGGCAIAATAWSTDGKTLFSAGDDHRIRVWDVNTGKQTAELQGHENTVTGLATASDGLSLLSASLDGTIRRWDWRKKQQTQKHACSPGDSDAFAYYDDPENPAVKLFACAGFNNTIRIYDATSGKEQILQPGSQSAYSSQVLSRDGKRMAAVSVTGVIEVWETQEYKLLQRWSAGQAGDLLLAFAPDHHTLVSAGLTLKFWDTNTGAEKAPEIAKNDNIQSLAFSPNGRFLALGTRGQRVEVLDWASKKVVQEWKYPRPVNAVGFSPDSGTIAAAGGPKILQWDVASGKELRQFHCKDEGNPASMPDVSALAFSPDSKHIAVACFDAVIRVLDATTGKEKYACEGHISFIHSLAFSRDGRLLISGSFDQTARVWEGFSGRTVAVLKGHIGAVTGVAISPDGQFAYSASTDTTAMAWDVTGMGRLQSSKIQFDAAEVDRAWTELASDDAARANPMVWRLVAAGADVVPLLGKKVYLVDPAQITSLITDLDSGEFKERDDAFKNLLQYGRWVEGRLQDELKKTGVPLEQQRRMTQLLEKITQSGSITLAQERLRLHRTMMILEQIGGDASRDVFRSLEKQGPEEAFRDSARVSLARMNSK